METAMVISAITLLLAVWIVPVVLGVRAALAKGVSPHWMWFGVHPFGAWIAFLVIRFGVRPRIRCPQCAEKLMSHAKVCAYCGHPLDGLVNVTAAVSTPRRRVWPIVVIVGGFFAFVVAFSFGLVGIIAASFNHSDVARLAFARAQSDTMLKARMGEPIKLGFMVSGSINESGPSGDADIDLPIHGPKSGGDLYAVATKSAGIWSFTTLVFQPDGSSERMDLLKEPSPAASSPVSK